MSAHDVYFNDRCDVLHEASRTEEQYRNAIDIFKQLIVFAESKLDAVIKQKNEIPEMDSERAITINFKTLKKLATRDSKLWLCDGVVKHTKNKHCMYSDCQTKGYEHKFVLRTFAHEWVLCGQCCENKRAREEVMESKELQTVSMDPYIYDETTMILLLKCTGVVPLRHDVEDDDAFGAKVKTITDSLFELLADPNKVVNSTVFEDSWDSWSDGSSDSCEYPFKRGYHNW